MDPISGPEWLRLFFPGLSAELSLGVVFGVWGGVFLVTARFSPKDRECSSLSNPLFHVTLFCLM